MTGDRDVETNPTFFTRILMAENGLCLILDYRCLSSESSRGIIFVQIPKKVVTPSQNSI